LLQNGSAAVRGAREFGVWWSSPKIGLVGVSSVVIPTVCGVVTRGSLVSWRRHRPNWFRYPNRWSRPAQSGTGIAARHEPISDIKHPAFGIDPQAIADGLSTILGLARVPDVVPSCYDRWPAPGRERMLGMGRPMAKAMKRKPHVGRAFHR